MYNLTDKQIVLGVTGSIAAYKVPDLASKLTQAGAAVDVAMTESATRFVAPITFQGVTGRRGAVGFGRPALPPFGSVGLRPTPRCTESRLARTDATTTRG